MRYITRDTLLPIVAGLIVAAFFGVVWSMIVDQSDKLDNLDTSIDQTAANIVRLVSQNERLRAEVATLKRKITPYQRCVIDHTFTSTSTAPIVVCTNDQDYVAAPFMGRYILFRGLGCGETFEDSFLLFKTRKDINEFIVSTVCSEEGK